MNLPLPNLDDRTYAEIVEDAIAQIAVEYPEWTDHNPSDTGIILIELLAWLTEMTLYQVNQIPDDNYVEFLNLLQGQESALSNASATEKQQNLQPEIQQTLLELRQRYRAVTAEDYEQLVLEDWNQSQVDTGIEIARVKCLPQRNLDNSDADTFADGHISLVVIPRYTKEFDGLVVVPEATEELDGLVLYYPLNRIITNGDNDPEVIDKSASKLNGTVKGSAEIVTDSEMGNCLSFDGVDDYVELPAINFDYSQGFTISVWVYFNEFGYWGGIIDLGQGYQDDNIFLSNGNQNNTLILYVFNDAQHKSIRENILEENKWLNVAVTVDGEGNAKIYRYGNPENSRTGLLIPTTIERNNNYIGDANCWGSTSLFNGKMARLRMYNRSLSQEEINQTLEQDQTEISYPITLFLTKLFEFLEERKLLTTRLHIVEPDYIPVTIETELVIKDGALAEEVKEKAAAEVSMFFAPLDSGKYWQGKGYPFGRNVYLSELYKLLDDLPGVDYVGNLKINDNEDLSEILLKDDQLVRFDQNASIFTIKIKVGNDYQEI